MGLVEAFNTLPDGSQLPPGARRTIPQIAAHLKNVYFKIGSSETERRRRMRERLDLYEDRGFSHFERMIRNVYRDRTVQDERVALLPYARFQNVTRRIASELAMVYKAPAEREVAEGNDNFQRFIETVNLDSELREAQRYIEFLNEVLLWIRTKKTKRGRVPVLDVITPDAFTVVPHPSDPKEMVAVILDKAPGGMNVRDQDPHYAVWDDQYRFFLDKNGNYIPDSEVTHRFGRIPGVLLHRRSPRRQLLDPDTGQDIIDAHKAVALLNVLVLHGQKTGTVAPYISGDVSLTPRGQALDHDKLTQFQEGVQPGVLDLKFEPSAYIDTARSVIAQLAANHGIPEDVFSLSHDASSGFDRRLKRMSLEERRQEQIPIFRAIERELAATAAAVLQAEAPAYSFKPESFHVRFGEIESPMDPLKKLDYRQKARSLGLRTALEDIREDYPDLDPEEARRKLLANVHQRAIEVLLMRALDMPRDPTKPGQSPQANGRLGGRKTKLRSLVQEALAV